jgi:hypothetical protein
MRLANFPGLTTRNLGLDENAEHEEGQKYI